MEPDDGAEKSELMTEEIKNLRQRLRQNGNVICFFYVLLHGFPSIIYV